MDRFLKEIYTGEIHFRDRWQFELKSEFFPLRSSPRSVYKQELYLFIPNSLQVNEETYNKKQYYQDQTVFIRYKTPSFKIEELYDPVNKKSPLNRLSALAKSANFTHEYAVIEDELKLLGNIVRSSLRDRVYKILRGLENTAAEDSGPLLTKVEELCGSIRTFREHYTLVQNEYFEKLPAGVLKSEFSYVDEFLSKTINYHLTGLLLFIRRLSPPNSDKIEEHLCAIIDLEGKHGTSKKEETLTQDAEQEAGEYILYRNGLLNKFVLDALLLNTTRVSLTRRFRNLIGSFAAGIAMLFFFVLFVKQGKVFIINSMPFILITVFLYILKDRMKEWIKNISYRQFAKWYSDYETDIYSHDEKTKLGKLTESVSFVSEKKLSEEIIRIRNREFHYVLEDYKRPEKVLYSKKSIIMYRQSGSKDPRRNALNLIYRFNIHSFLQKADNPVHEYVKIDPETHEFIRKELPKVYHLNIILKNTYMNEDLKEEIEFKKFRIILDKNGIKRIEKLHAHKTDANKA